MVSLPLSPKVIKKDKNKAVIEIENLYPGYGVTIGNALRRTLLSSLEGCAVTEFKIKGVNHEFSTIPGVLEDVIMICQNLKGLRFKIFEGETQTATLKMKGEKKITGKDLDMPTQMELANPEWHITTLTGPKSEIEMEIKVERGLGYELKETRKKEKSAIGTVALDAIFTPIKNVTFAVENMRVGDRTDFDKLSLEIETDGTMTPEEAFEKSCELLIKHFNLFLVKEAPVAIAVATEEENTKVKVEDMDLSSRTLTALVDNSIKTAAGLIKKTEKALLELEGMGEVGIKEIKKALKKLGLSLKEEDNA